MWTKEKVREFANEIGYRHQFTSGELNSLHSVLSVDEECYGMTEGMIKKVHTNKSSGYGIAVLTNQRFLFYHKGFLGSVTIEEFPIDTISSISLHEGALFGSLYVYAANVDEVIVQPCDNNNAARIVQAWKHLSNIQKIFNEPIAQQPKDSAAELEKWHQLKEKGIITEEEYNSKKKQLLGL
jgi:hypothetical protein